MSNYRDFVSTLLAEQKGAAEEFANEKRTDGEVISQQAYKNYLDSLFKSTADSFQKTTMFYPFVENAVLSEYTLKEFFKRMELNLNFLSDAWNYADSFIQETESKYDTLIEQAKDNYHKLSRVKSMMIPIPVSTDLPLPLETYPRQTLLVPQVGFIHVQPRYKTVSVNKMALDGVFPIKVVGTSSNALRNYNTGFSINVYPTAAEYKLIFKHYEFDTEESLTYTLEFERHDDKLMYRASADGSYFGAWRPVYNINEFTPVYNDYEEPIGLEFKLVPRRSDDVINYDWFLSRRVHNIRIVHSTDYGFVYQLGFMLEKPAIVSSISLFNFGESPFILERIEGSIDNVTYYTIDEPRKSIIENAYLGLHVDFPVKYVKLILKQETYDMEYKPSFQFDDLINSINTNYDSPIIGELLNKYYYHLSYKVLRSKELRDILLGYLRSKNWSEYTVERKYVYEINLGSVLINERDLIIDYIG